MADEIIKLGINVNSLSAVKANQDLDKLGQTSEKTGRRITKSTGQMKSGFASATKAIGAMAAAALSLGTVFRAVSSARKFNASIAEVSTLIEGTPEQINKLTKATKELAIQFGSEATDQVAGFYQAISAGAETIEDASEIVTQANKLAVGGVSNLYTAVDALTTAVNVYKSSGLSAAQASDSLFTAVKFGKTTVDELGSSIGKVLPLASSLGVTFDEVTSAIAALTKGGISTREAVTGVRAVLASVAKPNQQASEAAEKLGLNFTSSGIQALGFAGFLEKINEAAQGDVAVLAELFGGVEALVPVLAFAGDAGGYFTETMTAMGQKTGATDKAFNKISETMDQRLSRATSKLSVGMLGLGTSVLRIVTPAIEFLSENIAKLATILATALASFVLYKAALLSTAIATGGLTVSTGLLLSTGLLPVNVEANRFIISLTLLKGALLKTGIGALIVGLGLLVHEISLASEKVGGFGKLIENVFDKAVEKLTRVYTWIKAIGLTLKGAAQAGFGFGEASLATSKEVDILIASLDKGSTSADSFAAKLQGLKTGTGPTEIPEGNLLAQIKENIEFNLALTKSAVAAKIALAEKLEELNKIIDPITKENIALQIQVDVLSLSSSAAEIYIERKSVLAALAEKNIILTAEENSEFEKSLELRRQLITKLDQSREAAQLFAATRTPVEQFEKKMEDLNELVKSGAIDWDLYTRSVLQAQDGFVKLKSEAENLGNTLDTKVGGALDRITGSLESFLSSGGSGGISDVLSSIQSSISGITSGVLSTAVKDQFFEGLEDGSKKSGKKISGNLNLGTGDLFDGLSGLGDKIKNGITGLSNSIFGSGGVRGNLRTQGSFPNSGIQSGSGATQIPTGFGSDIGTGGISVGTAAVGLAVVGGVIAAVNGSVAGVLSAVGALAGAYFGPIGSAIGAAIGGLVGSLFSSTKKTIAAGLDLTFNPSSLDSFSFKTVKKKSFFKKTIRTARSELNAELQGRLEVFNVDTRAQISALGKSFGVTGATNFQVVRKRISLLGLSVSETESVLNSALDEVREDLARRVVGTSEFVRSGETFTDALERMAEAITSVNAAFGPIGLRIFEISRAGADAASRLIEASGGLSNFTSSIDFFFKNFYSAAEQFKINSDIVGDTIAKLGIEVIPNSRREFKDLLTSLQSIGDTDAVAALLKIAPLFVEITDAANEAANANVNLFRTLADQVFTSSGKVTPFRKNGREDFPQTFSTSESSSPEQILNNILAEITNGNIEIIRNTKQSARSARRLELNIEAA